MALHRIGTLEEARARLLRGDALTFPTETVVGLGLSVARASSPDRLYGLKGRPAAKPISWLIPSKDSLTLYGEDVPGHALRLADAFWPGPATLVVRASDAVPRAFRSDEGTIGLRMPDHPTPLALMGPNGIDGPLATTSANLSGNEDAVAFAEISPDLLEQAPFFDLTSGNEGEDASHASGLASTVIDCTGPNPRILREGFITEEMVNAALG